MVVGIASYAGTHQPLSLNDAALLAQSLKTDGFEVIEGTDFDQTTLLKTFRDFLARLESRGPDTNAFFYFNGLALQSNGDNFLVPRDARLERVGDLPIETVRLNDMLRPLASLPLKSRIVILDAGRISPFWKINAELARGLSAVEKSPGIFIGFSQSPGLVYSMDGRASYGPFAVALSEMLHEPGLTFNEAFDRIRLRVHEKTEGRQIPYRVDGLSDQAVLAASEPDRAADFSALADRRRAFLAKPDSELTPEVAYTLAIEQDTLPVYLSFVAAFPQHRLAARIRRQIAVRRESLYWLKTVRLDTRDAYWTYLKIYGHGPHAPDARRALTRLDAPAEPPSDFDPLTYDDLPPPTPEEMFILNSLYARPVYEAVYYDDFLPVPPDFLVPPPTPYLVEPPPPSDPAFSGMVPAPAPVPLFIPNHRLEARRPGLPALPETRGLMHPQPRPGFYGAPVQRYRSVEGVRPPTVYRR